MNESFCAELAKDFRAEFGRKRNACNRWDFLAGVAFLLMFFVAAALTPAKESPYAARFEHCKPALLLAQETCPKDWNVGFSNLKCLQAVVTVMDCIRVQVEVLIHELESRPN